MALKIGCFNTKGLITHSHKNEDYRVITEPRCVQFCTAKIWILEWRKTGMNSNYHSCCVRPETSYHSEKNRSLVIYCKLANFPSYFFWDINTWRADSADKLATFASTLAVLFCCCFFFFLGRYQRNHAKIPDVLQFWSMQIQECTFLL